VNASAHERTGRAGGAELSSGPIASQFAAFDRDLWLARRLGRNGVLVEDLFNGVTDAAERKRRLRQAILDRGVADIRCGSDKGRALTYRQAFERIYGEPLSPDPQR
jgi:hypothetical protein